MSRHRATPANEVHLRRLTVDEALIKLDQYLNDAFMAGLYQVRIVHGKGTGTLRQIVREQLAKHPLVKSYRPAGYGEGGEGVTVVELAPR
jgi:DNA mismatch repair protein MutS2